MNSLVSTAQEAFALVCPYAVYFIVCVLLLVA